jgi:hypothetical protein
LRLLITLLLCCLVLLGFGQDSSNNYFANPLPKGPIIADGQALTIDGKPIYLHGTNISYLACWPEDPAKAADYLARHGYNWIRLHHVDDLIRRGEKTVDGLVKFIEALYARGIRVSIDGISQYGGYSKLSLYQGQNRADYAAYVRRLQPVLALPATWMFCLINEGYTELKNSSSVSRAPELYTWGKDLVQGLGFRGQVGDGGDQNIDPPLFKNVALQQDIVLNHIYGVHPQGGRYMVRSWAENGDYAGVSFWLKNLSGRPMVFQEVGCLPFASDRGVNEVFIASEARKKSSGICYFQEMSNIAQWRVALGTGTVPVIDDTATVTDYVRMVARLAGALIAKYGGGPDLEYYNGHDVKPTPKRDPNYQRVTEKVKVYVTREKATVIVSVAPKKRYVFLLDQALVRGYTSTTGADGWISTTNRGGRTLGFWEATAVDLGAEVSGAYRLDPWTLRQVGTMLKVGTTFIPDRTCGAYEINLK